MYSLIASSYDADASTSSLGCHATTLTSCECSINTDRHSNSASGCTSQIHTDLSRAARRQHAARREKSGPRGWQPDAAVPSPSCVIQDQAKKRIKVAVRERGRERGREQAREGGAPQQMHGCRIARPEKANNPRAPLLRPSELRGARPNFSPSACFLALLPRLPGDKQRGRCCSTQAL
ncbi:hypothetical protein L1887_43286 [Cichorium endivia]|nr:hypothetical protein L1887_43286 [Cichorium endivia]